MLTPTKHKIAIHVAFVALSAWLLLTSLLIPQTVSPYDPSHTTTNEEGEKHLIDRRIASYTLGLVFFTGMLAISTIGLWVATARGFRNQSQETKVLQRAYLAVEPLGIHLMREGNRVLGHVGIKNAGHLPARDVSWRVRLKLDYNGGLTKFPLQEEEEGRIVIAPGSIARQGSQDSVLLDEIAACGGGGSAYLYVWGIVQYNNGFKKRCFTKFCHRYNCRGQPIGAIPETGARYHTHGNDAD